MTVSDKATPDDPEKTFLSFSDNVNSSIATKSVEDETNQDKAGSNQEDDEAQILNSKQKPPRRPTAIPLVLDTQLVNEQYIDLVKEQASFNN